MNIDEIRVKRREAEDQINAILVQLQKETGMQVRSIGFSELGYTVGSCMPFVEVDLKLKR